METKEEGFFDFLLGYRKTLAWVGMFVVGCVFCAKGYINGGQFVDLQKATFLGFITGNLGEHLGNLGQAYFKTKGPALVAAVKDGGVSAVVAAVKEEA